VKTQLPLTTYRAAFDSAIAYDIPHGCTCLSSQLTDDGETEPPVGMEA
jgi:hypothetical protein